MRPLRATALVVAAIALLAVGMGSASTDDSSRREILRSTTATTTSGRSTSPASRSAASSASRLAAARRAVATAELSVRRSRAYDIETDRLQGKQVWDVEVARSTTRAYELDIRADGREVVRQRRKPGVDDDVRTLAGAGVSLRRALEIAGARWKADRFDEAEIDRWRGRVVWEVMFRGAGQREVEVRIDARSGTVIAVEVDD